MRRLQLTGRLLNVLSNTWRSLRELRFKTSRSIALLSVPAQMHESKTCVQQRRVVKGYRINSTVSALVVPGSYDVKKKAELEGS
jgi:hypothetical protein